MGDFILERASRLDAFSAYPFRRSQTSHALGRTTGTRECVRPGPLVLGTAFLKSPTAASDRDRTVSRRSKPSSRTALMGEQPNPWDRLRPRMRRADIEVPNLTVDMDSWGRSACYPRGTFYPLSDGASTRNRRITMPCFRTCSTCRSRSQAPFCHCTRRLIANQPEGTFGRLRYSLGGDRPSQTTRLTLFLARVTVVG